MNTNISEIKAFIGIHNLIGVISLKSHTIYLSKTLHYEPVASLMLEKGFETLQICLYLVDDISTDQSNENKS